MEPRPKPVVATRWTCAPSRSSSADNWAPALSYRNRLVTTCCSKPRSASARHRSVRTWLVAERSGAKKRLTKMRRCGRAASAGVSTMDQSLPGAAEAPRRHAACENAAEGDDRIVADDDTRGDHGLRRDPYAVTHR